MSVHTQAFMTTSTDSLETGREVARRILADAEPKPPLVVTYATVNHDQALYLRGLSEVLGDGTAVVGCSAQGLIGNGNVREDGFAAGAMAFGGAGVFLSDALVENVANDPREKGAELGRILKAGLPAAPTLVVMHYDALCGLDPELFMEGLFAEVNCAIVGGAAAHSFNYQAVTQTYQYHGQRVLSRAACGFAMYGDFSFEIACCHGCSPIGVELTVTRAEGNVIYELDGRRAIDVWTEISGDPSFEDLSSALAIGVPVQGIAGRDFLVRAAYSLDSQTGAATLGPAIARGTKIMLHHRTVEDVLLGAQAMGRDLQSRFGKRRPRGVLGFECAARTGRFLGSEGTATENLDLQRALGSGVPWLGMMPWGELCPVAGKPSFHNYSYVTLALLE